MIIVFSGKIGSGKTTAANYLKLKYGFLPYSFARPLKKIGKIFGFSHNEMYGTQKEKLSINEKWGISGREFLQKVGTELFRNNLQKVLPNIQIEYGIWSDIFMNKYKEHNDNYVIDDMRFEDEYNMLRDLGAIFVECRTETKKEENKKDKDCGNQDSYKSHISERSLNNIEVDHIIINNGTMKDMYKSLSGIMEQYIDHNR